MNKPICLLALALAGTAHAQSSVTVYGVVDAYVQALDGASRTVRVGSSGLQGSRLGFRGAEDLGDGLKAMFVLESGINVDDGTVGQGGVFWGRQAYLGLQGRYGQLTLGRQYSSIWPATTDFSIFSNSSTGPSTAVIGGFGGGYEPVRGAGGSATPPAAGATGNGGPTRINNAVRYQAPEWQGITASLVVGAGEIAGATNDSRLVDLSARYRNGRFDAIVSHVDDKAASTADASIVTHAVTTTVAVGYSLAPWHVVAGVLAFDDRRAANLDGRGYWIGAEYHFGSQLWKAQWVRNQPRYGADNRTDAYGLGWQYDFSKRTAVYASLTRFNNQANAGSGGLGRFNAAIPAGLTTSASNSINELALGLRHSF
jgi:predicted porin